MPPRRRCYERDRCQESAETGGAIAGAVTRASNRPRRRPGWIEPGLLPPQGILFVGGEPKVGKIVCWWPISPWRWPPARTAPAFPSPLPRRVLVCQFELPIPQFVGRLAVMRRIHGSRRRSEPAGGHARHRPSAQRAAGTESLPHRRPAAAAEVIVLDPLYSTHDQDENDTRSMAALCQSLLRLRDASKAALIVVHHVRKSIGRYEIGSAFRGSCALHAVGDCYLLLTRPSPHLPTVELRFQFRYAAPQPPRLLQLDPADAVVFRRPGRRPATAAARRKVEQRTCDPGAGGPRRQARYNQLREQIMELTECSKRTAQLAIAEACRQGSIVQADGQYRCRV